MKKLNRKRYTSLAAGMAIMIGAAQPVHAITVDIFGTIDAFNTIADPLTDIYGDEGSTPTQDWTGFYGLAVGDTVQMTVTYDELDITGTGFEEIGFSAMTINFIDSLGDNALTYHPDITDDDEFNVLYFENGNLFNFDLDAFSEDGSDYDYLQYSEDSYFSIYDYDSETEEVILQGSYQFSSLPPVTNIPIPAALWLFGSGLIGLVGIARRKTNH